MEEDFDSDEEMDVGNEDNMLSPQAFAASPNPQPPKRTHPTSPDVFSHFGMSPDPNLFSPAATQYPAKQPPIQNKSNNNSEPYPEPFEAEKVFQLYKKEEYLHAGHVFQQNCPTIFHKMQSSIDETYPYKPFFDEEEWSLAEFLATSHLSKGSINTFFNSAWVCKIVVKFTGADIFILPDEEDCSNIHNSI